MTVEFLHGNCSEIMEELHGDGREFGFVFADPPFNIGQKYTGFRDRCDPAEYASFTHNWVTKARQLLTNGGILALHGPDELAEMYLAAAPPLKRIAWINWHYRFGQCRTTNWIDDRCHCLVYSNGRHTWNPDAVLVQSDRVKYGDKRAKGLRLPGCTWGVPSDGPCWGRVQGSNAERRPLHPNQLPEKYLERLLLAYTNPGDWVLDPFCGSGTTAVVADALGRNCVTIDISEENLESAKERLEKGAVRVETSPLLHTDGREVGI